MEKHNERYMWLALGVVIIGTFMAILDSSIVNIAIPKMMTIFGSTTDQIQWVLTGYMLTMGVVIPLTGYLGDTFGYKKMYIFALTVFTAGSALCGVAWSTESMVAARVVQAIGGGMIMPIGMSMTYRIIPLEKRGLALGIWGISAMAAPAIGPTLSGYIVEFLDWRLIFTINIPVGILAISLAVVLLQETPRVSHMKFDLWGAVTSSTGLITLLLALSKVNSKGWNSGYTLGLLLAAVFSLSLFVFIELRHPEPLLELRVLRNSAYSLSLLISTVTTIGLFGGVYLIPLYMENLRGYSAMETGMLMLPSAIATGLMMPISGKLFDKYGARGLTIVGLSILSICTYMLSKITLETPYETIRLLMVIRGMGMGLCMMPVQTAGMNSVAPSQVGRASALNNTVRQVNGSLGISILTTILQHRQAFHSARYVESLNLTSTQVMQTQAAAQGMFAASGLNPMAAKMVTSLQVYSQVIKNATVTALDDTFMVAAVICFIGLPLALLIKRGVTRPLGKPQEAINMEV